MKAVGAIIDLSFEVEAIVDSHRWRGPLRDLIAPRAIVSVYMKNNTSACDAQLAALKAACPTLAELGWRTVGVSKDAIGSHAKVAAKLGAPFALVADTEQALSRELDAMVAKQLYGRAFVGASRSAYALSGDGQLLGVVERVDARNHEVQLLELARALAP